MWPDIPTYFLLSVTILVFLIALLYIDIRYLTKKLKVQDQEIQHLLDLEDKRREFDSVMAQWSIDVDNYLRKLTNQINQGEGDKPTFH